MAARKKMNQAARAKQFMPFAALKGYDIALRAKEKILVPKIELSEEMAEKLDCKLRMIKKNDIVTVVYFCNQEYLEVTGMVSRLDSTARVLQVVNTKIPFADIYDLKGEIFDS
ncbi:MAG: YolD-like family protein [Eubacterium sp.]|nr:YolD-like family protein [Eubacterium sp.]